MDRWYALQVTTGAEGDVKTRLDRLAYPAMLPMKIMRERRDGRWRDETKVMLPGYLFVQAAMTAADWHRIRRLPGVLRILGGDRPSPLSDDETARIQWLDNGGTPWALSEYVQEDGSCRIVGGPLAGKESEILSFNLRQNRARIRACILGEEKTIELGVTAQETPGTAETISSAAEEG